MEPVSATERVCSIDRKSSGICSENSPKPQHPLTSADKRPSLTSGDSLTVSASDSQISTLELRQQRSILSGHWSRDAEVSMRQETIQRRSSSTSADRSQSSSSAASRHGRSSPSGSQHHRPSSHRAPESSKDRSTYHSRRSSSGRELRSSRQESGSHAEPESSKDRSAYHSGSFSSGREHRSSRQDYGGEFKIPSNTQSLERLQYCPESNVDAKSNVDTRCDRRSGFHRLNYQKDSVSCQDRKKHEPSSKGYTEPFREQRGTTSSVKADQRQPEDLARYHRRDAQLSKDLGYQKVGGDSSKAKCEDLARYNRRDAHLTKDRDRDRLSALGRDSCKAKVKESEDLARYNRRSTQITKDLDRLSVVGGDSSEVKVKDCEEESLAEYKDVLTRHVNQLFIRGDNVTLVAIVG